METIQHRYRWLNTLAVLLVAPAFYFITINILKFELGVDGPYDASVPVFERLGLKENLGWYINLLILLGPVCAVFIAVLQLIRFNWQLSNEELELRLTVRKKKFPLFILFLGGIVLSILFIYLVMENLIIR